jgi:hypothetical protein
VVGERRPAVGPEQEALLGVDRDGALLAAREAGGRLERGDGRAAREGDAVLAAPRAGDRKLPRGNVLRLVERERHVAERGRQGGRQHAHAGHPNARRRDV